MSVTFFHLKLFFVKDLSHFNSHMHSLFLREHILLCRCDQFWCINHHHWPPRPVLLQRVREMRILWDLLFKSHRLQSWYFCAQKSQGGRGATGPPSLLYFVLNEKSNSWSFHLSLFLTTETQIEVSHLYIIPSKLF